MTGFNKWNFPEKLLEVLQRQGIVKPTAVQAAAIPALLTGDDVIVQAQTGTGKTLAFLLSIMAKLRADRQEPQALIITPTRELAIQITAEARNLTEAYEGISMLAAYGGQDVERQLRKLNNGAQLVIGTPGRLLDHLRRGSLTLGGVRMLVLDEADQMLHMGFLTEVEDIIRLVPSHRQTMLFSATMSDHVKRLAKAYMDRPRDIRIVETSRVTLEAIRQIAVECTDRGKQNALIERIRSERPYLAVIFCRTKRRASKLNEALQEAGFASDELHGDLSQAKREKVMRAFREAKLELLVATDVAARGIDVEGVTHVFNYDIPQDVDSYIHRIGRTGRAGEKGTAITFVAPRDMDTLRLIEKGISSKLERVRIATERTGFSGNKMSQLTGSSAKKVGSRTKGAAVEALSPENSAGRAAHRKQDKTPNVELFKKKRISGKGRKGILNAKGKASSKASVKSKDTANAGRRGGRGSHGSTGRGR